MSLMRAVLVFAAFTVGCVALPTVDEASQLSPPPTSDQLVQDGPDGWKITPLEDKTPVLPVTLVLKKENLHVLAETALAVSTPGSPRYGKFLTTQEVFQLTPVADGAVAALTNWMRTEEISGEVDELQGEVHLTAPIHQLETIFQTTFHSFTHPELKLETTRGKSYTLPGSIERFVWAVFGVTGLPLGTKQGPVVLTSSQAEPHKVTPNLLRSTYNVSGVDVSRSKTPRQAVAEFQGQTMSEKDLKHFFRKYVSDAQSGDDEVAKFVGSRNKGEAGDEAELDIQYIMGPAAGIKTEFWGFQKDDFCKDLKNWTTTMLAASELPVVHSVSYGWQGDVDAIGCHKNELDDIDTNFQRLAAIGITIIFSSGDSGSGFQKAEPCDPSTYLKHTKLEGEVAKKRYFVSLDGCCSVATRDEVDGWSYDEATRECVLYSEVRGSSSSESHTSGYSNKTIGTLWASWPASSPWVTAVGATRFIDQSPEKPEMASDQFGSGGGFSTMFTRPSWQSEAVSEYLNKTKLPPQQLFPAGGRATPDVSGLGEGYQVVVDGSVESIGGTSASAPMFASLVSLLNEARSQHGKARLGFLNPFLYQNKDCFNDVTRGTGKIDRDGEKAEYGFDCAEGWDPVTGLGTPKFSALLSAALKA